MAAPDPGVAARLSDLRHMLRNRLAAIRNASFYLQRRAQGTQLWTDDPRTATFFELIARELGEIERALSDELTAEHVLALTPAPTTLACGRLLLVDDHAGNRATLGALLSDEGFTVDEADTIASARARLQQETAYDAVLLDRGLDDGDGAGLIPVVRARNAGTKVLVVSGRTEEAVDGADGVVGKERGFDILLDRLRAVLDAR